jgi:UDP-N-acetylglucosamine 3-dehydrogenase
MADEKPVKLGLIGVGVQGRKHLVESLQLDNAELRAVADVNPAVRELALRHGLGFYSDARDLLLCSGVDAVIVAVPTDCHYAIGAEALNAGKHVLVEKPMARTSQEAKELIASAEKRGLVLAVGHVEQYNPAFRLARELLSSLGPVLTVVAYRVGPDPVRIRDSILFDLGVHDFLLLRTLFGPIRSVLAWGGRHQHSYEDYAVIRLTFANGVHATVHLDWFHPVAERHTVVTCECGVLTLDYRNQRVAVSTRKGVEQAMQLQGSPLRAELEDFVTAVSTGQPPLVSARDGLDALVVVEAALRSLEIGAEVEPQQWSRLPSDPVVLSCP